MQMNYKVTTSSHGRHGRRFAELRRRQLEAAMAGDMLRSAQYAQEARELRMVDDDPVTSDESPDSPGNYEQ
ncbi:MAG: hypothetical protein JJU36_07850 [Phycisphaeraceae bacterium]|nr:hypothetical protein [Phycisphaeraceae bacterium]